MFVSIRAIYNLCLLPIPVKVMSVRLVKRLSVLRIVSTMPVQKVGCDQKKKMQGKRHWPFYTNQQLEEAFEMVCM